MLESSSKPETQTSSSTAPWYLAASPPVDAVSALPIETLLMRFHPISLREMDSAALLNRIDTKFVMPVGQLMKILSSLYPFYRILCIQNNRLNHYRTLYFDTPDFRLFNLHVNGQADRYKVRSREYVDSQISFLEVKHKTSKDRTIKDRISTHQPLPYLTRENEQWLNTLLPCESRRLEPKLWNTFTRITLVGSGFCERVTLDLDLAFTANGKSAFLDGIAIAEVKRDGRCGSSPFLSLMREMHIKPRSFSKYCMGTALVFDHVKKNRLKSKILWIEKISKGA